MTNNYKKEREYVETYLDDLKPKTKPTGYSVLVIPHMLSDIFQGKIMARNPFSDETRRILTQQVECTIVAKGSASFGDTSERWRDEGEKPDIGTKVIIEPNSGMWHQGYDKKHYRLLNDDDILAVLEKEPLFLAKEGK